MPSPSARADSPRRGEENAVDAGSQERSSRDGPVVQAQRACSRTLTLEEDGLCIVAAIVRPRNDVGDQDDVVVVKEEVNCAPQ